MNNIQNQFALLPVVVIVERFFSTETETVRNRTFTCYPNFYVGVDRKTSPILTKITKKQSTAFKMGKDEVLTLVVSPSKNLFFLLFR